MEALHQTFEQLTEVFVLVINFMALFVVAYGTLEAFIKAVRQAFFQSRPVFHPVWMRYARWLVAGLTFQLAADIIESALAPSWDEIGQLAAIAAIRTFLNYFLGRDMAEVVHEEEPAPSARAEAGSR